MQNFQTAFQFLLPPFIMCLLLSGIHCYLGIHVLARGVIFVDLSLAQVAAFGATIAVFLGYDHHSKASYFISLICTFLAAALFALARKYEKKFPQEALIGIVYALASASVVLVIDKIAHGAEHIKDILVGQVLWVTWNDIYKTSAIYFFVSCIHYIFRKKLISSSFGTSKSNQSFWDFIFYALFGVVITSSVSLAGVLQVFAFLIVPSVTSNLFFKTIKHKLIFGWVLSFVLSLIGICISYAFDYPTGAFIVVCFTGLPICLFIIHFLYLFIKNRGFSD